MHIAMPHGDVHRARPRQAGILRLPAAVGAMVLLSLTVAGVLPAQVAVDELEVHIQLARGATAPHLRSFPIRNDDTTAHQVRIVVGDWHRDTLGQNQFPEATGQSLRCGARLQVFPTTLRLAPKTTELVRVSYEAAPADTGCWAIAYVETVRPPAARPDAQGSFLTIEVRTGVKIYVHREGAVALGEVRDIQVRRAPPQPRGAQPPDTTTRYETAVWFQSTGTAHLRVKNTLEIRSATGALLHTVAGQEAYMTPDALRVVRLLMPALDPGEYVAVVLLDYGGDEIAAAQLDFRIP